MNNKTNISVEWRYLVTRSKEKQIKLSKSARAGIETTLLFAFTGRCCVNAP